VRIGGERAQRRAGVREEVLLQQQVLGRIAGQRQLREQDEIGLRLAGRADAVTDPVGVALDVADGGVDLTEG
jgi:hypothetical protein